MYLRGVKKDPVAAKHYLEVAANLGDTGMLTLTLRICSISPDPVRSNCGLDAMNEVAWCYLQGFGCKVCLITLFIV